MSSRLSVDNIRSCSCQIIVFWLVSQSQRLNSSIFSRSQLILQTYYSTLYRRASTLDNAGSSATFGSPDRRFVKLVRHDVHDFGANQEVVEQAIGVSLLRFTGQESADLTKRNVNVFDNATPYRTVLGTVNI